MLRSGKRYQPEMSEVTDLLKAWMAESRQLEERREREHEEERKRYEQQRVEERLRYEELIRGITDRRPRRVEVGPESLKLTKLADNDDIEAFLTTFERAAQAHGVEADKWAAILAPQLTGKARLAYAAMADEQARDYGLVKVAILQRYDINEETYRRRFRSVKPLDNETPLELVIRVRDLAGKWLKDYRTRGDVVDAIVTEQFVNVLPEDVKVWVKERKPKTSEEAGRLAEDYRQARKTELWSPGPKTAKQGGPKSCYTCGQVGHLAKDCSGKKVSLPPPSKGEDLAKKKKEEKPLVCYNCGGRGHTSRKCPSDAMFCRSEVGKPQANQPFRCQGLVGGQFVEDIVLDTGCSRTLVRGDLVSKENLILGRAITVQCAHGDVVMYPVASVEIEIQGNTFTVEAGVSDKLPQSVLLGTDVPGLKELLKGEEKAHMVVTRSQACRLKQS